MSTIQTQKAEIVCYWESRIDECDLSLDWTEAAEHCWRCGYQASLERAHIVPHSLGGPDTPSNYVLLCKRCHREAPNASDPEFMWTWLRAHAAPLYDTYWSIRGMREFELLYGRKPFANISQFISYEEIGKLLNPFIKKVTCHFGEGHLNSSTIAWCLRELERELDHQPPNPMPQPSVTSVTPPTNVSSAADTR